jgi:proline dehydrogenase
MDSGLARLWQKSMIRFAQLPGLARAVEASARMRRLSGRFIGGRTGAEGVACASSLQREGLKASLFYLGEYVAEPDLIERSVLELIGVIPLLAAADLDVHVSVDPTEVGSMLGWDQCVANVGRIARAMAGVATDTTGPRRVLMLDMEDSSVTEKTLGLRRELFAQGIPAAVTVQAYLKRTGDDIERLIDEGATVRLVKGAIAEPASIAHTARADIDASYLRLIERLLSPEARTRGVYPAFGTHDEKMMAYARRVAETNGWRPSEWEVEMLMGVRPTLQRRLAAEGVAVRLYLPFGERFWPYTIRRVGENPRNLGFVLHALRPSRTESGPL